MKNLFRSEEKVTHIGWGELANPNLRSPLLTVLCIVLGVGAPFSAKAVSDCDEKIKIFLATPSEQTLTATSGMDDKKCWEVIGYSNDNLNRLIHSVEQGNRWAAQYLAEHLKELDGGNLGDSLRALGQFSVHNMEQLLRFKKDGQISEYQFKNALTNLPLSLSDNLRGQLDALKTRRKRVMQITRDDLIEERAVALKVIDDALFRLKLIIQQTSCID